MTECPACDTQLDVLQILDGARVCPRCGSESRKPTCQDCRTERQRQCPHCETDVETLFDIAQSEPIEPANTTDSNDVLAALTDGGVIDAGE